MQFSELGLSAEIVRAVHAQGYTHPTPIQLQAIPAVLRGGDLLAGAQTGTGKTAGFTLPLLHRLSTQARPRHAPVAVQPARAAGTRHGGARAATPPVRALVMAPTRELAIQVEESVAIYGQYTGLKSMAMFGGVGMQPQIDRLRAGVDILVATPGRLLDHHQQGTLNLSEVEILVLDEADRMLDMGFIHDIRKVLALLPESRQNLLFSATFSDDIKRLATGLLKQPAIIEVARRNTTVETVEQIIHPVARESKRLLLAHLINSGDWHQVLVFTRTKHGANRLAEQLDRDGITAMAIHGNKSQGARVRALGGFKDGTVRVLVATDIAARGIDIDQLPHVVNYDLPNVSEDYVHRIGRTGRAGATGEARSLVCSDDLEFLADIEKLIGRKLQREVIAGFEPDPAEIAEPVLRGRGGQGGRSGQGGSRAASGGNGGGNGGRSGGRSGGGNAGGRAGDAPKRPAGQSGRPSAAGAASGAAGAARSAGRPDERRTGASAGRPAGASPDGRRAAGQARAPQGVATAPQRGNAGGGAAGQQRTAGGAAGAGAGAGGEGAGNAGRRRRRSGSRPNGGLPN